VSAEFVPLLEPAPLDALRGVLAGFGADDVFDRLGPVGRAAQERGDVAGALRELDGADPIATLIRLFLLGVAVPEPAARAALGRLVDEPELVRATGEGVSARLEIRPYGEESGASWWVVSDFGSDVRPGPLAPDHVLGIGGASLNLAQLTIRTEVDAALDIGTGCGVQALHLSRHCERVVGTDVSARALQLAATTAALSGVEWELRRGSLLEPVQGETYDLVVANPPFVVSPGLRAGQGGHDYRDSGLSGDDVCRDLLSGIPGLLRPGGTASMLANWIIPPDGDWADRVGGWLTGRGCDAWVWQREVLGVGEYVALWLRDAGEVPGTNRWSERYTAWCDWFAAAGIPAVGMGLATMWRTDMADAIVRCEDVPQAVEQPAGRHLPGWIERQRWLAARSDAALLGARLQTAVDLVRTRYEVHDADGWQAARTTLRLSHAMRWELEADEAITSLVGACTGGVPLAFAIDLLAASLGAEPAEVQVAVLPVIRDLIGRGFLVPVGMPA
jgi:hypothetical protein